MLKPTIELLAGIPSVVFGFIGLTLIVPFIRNYFGGPGFSVLASALVLSIMILPTMVSVSYDALRAVPPAYREGMLAPVSYTHLYQERTDDHGEDAQHPFTRCPAGAG